LRWLRSRESSPDGLSSRSSLYRLAIQFSLVRLQPSPRFTAESLEALSPRFDQDGRLAGPQDDWSGRVRALAERSDLTARIRGALQQLDDMDRASFVLREIEQVPAEEAAAILRTSPETIRERAHRAHLILTGFLGQLFASAA
jgi:DNA-directed RNA polymerase specialized sigma24 family protein